MSFESEPLIHKTFINIMAYLSPQEEGKIKNVNTWTCQQCNYNENASELPGCQYCGASRFNTQGPIIQPTFVSQQAQVAPPQPAVVSVNVNVHHKYPKGEYKQIVDEQYEPGSYEERKGGANHKQKHCCYTIIRFLVWFLICGGLVMSIWWFICGMIYCCWFKPCVTISRYLLCGSGARTNPVELRAKCKCYDSNGTNEKNCCCDRFFILIWMITFGMVSTVLHLVFGILSLPFMLCGFRFSIIHFRICKVCLFNPYAVEIAQT
eukprot:138838_1